MTDQSGENRIEIHAAQAAANGAVAEIFGQILTEISRSHMLSEMLSWQRAFKSGIRNESGKEGEFEFELWVNHKKVVILCVSIQMRQDQRDVSSIVPWTPYSAIGYLEGSLKKLFEYERIGLTWHMEVLDTHSIEALLDLVDAI